MFSRRMRRDAGQIQQLLPRLVRVILQCLKKLRRHFEQSGPLDNQNRRAIAGEKMERWSRCAHSAFHGRRYARIPQDDKILHLEDPFALRTRARLRPLWLGILVGTLVGRVVR